jgi:hypothetical protein
MKRVFLILVAFAILIGIGLLFLFFGSPICTYAVCSRTVEFTFVVLDEETKKPIPGAVITFWKDAPPPQRKHIAEVITDESGVAKFVHENHFVEDVIGIGLNHKLQGIRRHPVGVGTFVDRYWCTLDIAAKGYIPLQYESLGGYEYDDNGYDGSAELHRFEFVIVLRRK